MKTRALLVGVGLLAASFGPALADNVTAAVDNWNAASRTLTLEDKSQFSNIAKEVAVPEVRAGDQVTVNYYGDEDGVQEIYSITVNRGIAKQVTPLTQKRG